MPDRPAAQKITVRIVINGAPTRLETYPMARLLDVLRELPGLTGTKEGCGEGECGACAIEMDGQLVNSCLVPVVQAEGASIRTIEGMADGETLHVVQQALLKYGGTQCGICTPGMILAAGNLLARNPQPSEAEIREGLAGNLCRCTGYTKILEAVMEACSGTRSLPGTNVSEQVR
jgi:carbon-monoxide dehydrogenase small subunit